MKRRATVRVLLIAAILVLGTALPARAQDRGVELGTSLASLMVGFGDNGTGTILGVPSGGFGILNPGLFVSCFVTPKVAIEPQVGLLVVSSNGDSVHIANVGVQADYFINGTRRSSPYVFGGAGFIHTTDADVTPKSFGAGAGYRAALGDRLTMRVDGRVTHFTEGGGNVFALTVSLGGMFGR